MQIATIIEAEGTSMERFGLGKFCLVGFGMLCVVAFAFRLQKAIYNFLFGSPLPLWLILLLLAASMTACLLSFVYRSAYDGRDVSGRPMLYDSVAMKLEVSGFIGLFVALVLIWAIGSQWMGWTWVVVFFAGEMMISSVAKRRVFAKRLWEAKIWFPDMSLAEQEARATLWTESGMEPVEYEVHHSQK